MARLTEEMVIARTRQSNLGSIKKLNCWGSDLVDVSLLRRITNVEVLSLSVNKIASLADFQYCRNLQELFVRKNNIRDLNQVCYLQDLPKLRNLWLDENPCASCEGYRLAVIRCLPRLEKLDNLPVLPEEVQDALRRGRELKHPDDEQPSPERNREEDLYAAYASDEQEESPLLSQNVARIGNEQRKSSSPEEEYYEPERRESSTQEYSPEPQPIPNSRSSVQNFPTQQQYEEECIVDQDERNQYEILSNSGQQCDDQLSRQYLYQQPQTHQEQTPYYERRTPNDRPTRPPPPPCNVDQRVRQPPMNHQPPYHRRPTTRNSNILSAVLCLVKELDYPSLEVVEMAVRCRMDELED